MKNLIAKASRLTRGRFPFYHATEYLRNKHAPTYAGQTHAMKYEGTTIHVEPSKYVGGKLWWAYGRELPLIKWAYHNAKPGAVYDVGACLGEWTHYFRRRGSNVWAFEPNPKYALALAATNPQVLRLALGKTKGVIQLETFEDNEGQTRRHENGRVTASLMPLDHVPYLPAPGLVKVDVEGMELDVLEGGKNVLTKHSPTLIVEDNDAGAIPYAESLGYEVVARFGANACLKRPMVSSRSE